MTTRNKPKSVSTSHSSSMENVGFSLRLPEFLKDLAEDCARSTGASLNGLICTALAEYLASRGYKVYLRSSSNNSR
jgi:predicted HicB family RNase H-like nuclease